MIGRFGDWGVALSNDVSSREMSSVAESESSKSSEGKRRWRWDPNTGRGGLAMGAVGGDCHSASEVAVEISSLTGLDGSFRAFFFRGDPFLACLEAKKSRID